VFLIFFPFILASHPQTPPAAGAGCLPTLLSRATAPLYITLICSRLFQFSVLLLFSSAAIAFFSRLAAVVRSTQVAESPHVPASCPWLGVGIRVLLFLKLIIISSSSVHCQICGQKGTDGCSKPRSRNVWMTVTSVGAACWLPGLQLLLWVAATSLQRYRTKLRQDRIRAGPVSCTSTASLK